MTTEEDWGLSMKEKLVGVGDGYYCSEFTGP